MSPSAARAAQQLRSTRFAALFMDPVRLQDALGEAERFADLEGRTSGECELLAHAAMHRFLLGRPAADVAAPLERAVADGSLVAAISPDSVWLQLVLGQLFKADRLDTARRTVAVVSAESQRRGSAPGFATASVWRAWIALREGAADAAEADARAAYEALPDGMWQHVFCATCLAEVLVERDRLDEAHAILEAATCGATIAPEPGVDLLLYAQSILRVAQGDHAGALADQLESRGRRDDGTPDPDFDGWLRIARMLHATGDEAGATREAEAALDWARTWGTPGYIGQALTASGLILGGDEGLARLREAVEQLERSPARRELARSLVELGAALRRSGQRVAAREPLRRAVALAAAGGLVATERRAREELRITGARVPRVEAVGVASLTPSERRIVDLAADGASNPEIAQALFVTVKTVEMHLGNAYRKLGIGSRRELAPLLGAD
jgi:ATP/maltotriose-dependent transcriptional regulator MalT